MNFPTEKRYQDIAFFNIEKKSPPEEKKTHPASIILATIIATLALLAIGYCVGVKMGAFTPPCCLALEYEFEF